MAVMTGQIAHEVIARMSAMMALLDVWGPAGGGMWGRSGPAVSKDLVMYTGTGDGRWDGVGSLVIGGLLVLIAIFLAREMNSLLIGESGTAEHVAAIHKALEAGNDVERIVHLKTLHLGPDELMVVAKIAVRHDETASSIAQAINNAEARIRSAVPITCVIYIEPDIFQIPSR